MKKLIVSPAPHIHNSDSTQILMRDVLIALAPAVIASSYFYGLAAIKLVLISIVACVGLEYLIQRFVMRTKVTVCDLSAVITGALLALNLPPNSPWWLAVIGSIVAIGVAKMTFGGLGQNIFNPALVGRVFLLVSFPVLMTDWTAPAAWGAEVVDATIGATPLSIIKGGLAEGMTVSEILAANPNLNYFEMLFARVGGSVGEVSALALLLGLIYMLVRRVIKPHIPLSILGTIAVMTGIFWLINPEKNIDPLFSILTGGVLLGSIFMATDYVTSPMSNKGMVIFGIGIGIITVLIRMFGSFPEGISFAILIMNAVVPLINKYCKPKRFAREVKNG